MVFHQLWTKSDNRLVKNLIYRSKKSLEIQGYCLELGGFPHLNLLSPHQYKYLKVCVCVCVCVCVYGKGRGRFQPSLNAHYLERTYFQPFSNNLNMCFVDTFHMELEISYNIIYHLMHAVTQLSWLLDEHFYYQKIVYIVLVQQKLS